MKRLIIPLLAVINSAISFTGYAQQINILEGDLAPLKGEKIINTEFTYENMRVDKFKTEAEYVAKNKDDHNRRKNDFTGKDWYKIWIDDRQNLYEPKFNKLFEKYSNIRVTVDRNDARYIITGDSYAETDAEVWIVEAVTGNLIAKILVENAKSSPGVTDEGERIAECYADAGKALGKWLKGKIK